VLQPDLYSRAEAIFSAVACENAIVRALSLLCLTAIAQAVERHLLRRRLDPDTIAAAAEAWVGAAPPLAGNEWKVDAACGLLQRCLDACRVSHGV